jgi:hypothetical protein
LKKIEAAKRNNTTKLSLKARLPDGIFSYQKSQIGYIWEGLEMENVGICYGH